MYYIPMLYLSAESGEGIGRVLPLACQVWRERQKQLADSAVDTAIAEAVESQPPPRVGTRRLKVFQARQDRSRIASFVLQVNDPKLVEPQYQRYLERKLRAQFGFRGVPLELVFTRKTKVAK